VIFDGVAFHNVATMATDHDDGGYRLRRIPDDVRLALNERAQAMYERAAGVECRFESAGEEVSVTLSSPAGPSRVVPFWGPFRGQARTVERSPTTLELSRPDHVRALDPEAVTSPFDPRVWRLRCSHRPGPIHYHGIEGEGVHPPGEDRLPSRRYLAYGTSITQGNANGEGEITYVRQAARRIGVDAINLGTGGSAYCESDIAEYIAGRDDWDLGTFELSVNMLNADFSVETFRERTHTLLETVAASDPDRPVVAITHFPYYDDLEGTDERSRAFRETLRAVVERIDRPNCWLLEGPALLDPSGLGADCLHPAEDGMITIGERLAGQLGDC
jgi:lysophospholipase L1-like esterase